MIVFILLPLAIASFFSYFLIKGVVVEKVKNSRQYVANVIASDLNKTIEEIVYASNTYGNQVNNIFDDLVAFKDVSQLSSFKDYQRYSRITDFIQFAFSKTAGLNAQVIYLNKRNFFISENSTLDYSSLQNAHSKVLDLKWRNSLDPNKLYWMTASELGISPLTKTEPHYFAVRVYKDFTTGENLGVIIVGIPPQYFQYLFLNADSGEFLLYDNKKQLIFQYPEKEKPSEYTEKLEVSASVPATGWRILYRSLFNNITGELSRTFGFYAIFLAVGISIFLIISVFIGNTIYKPINRLRKVAEEFGDGNLSVRFPVEGDVEIAILGNAFNNMLNHINQLIRKIKKEQEKKRLIELQALFAQIHPHFLINTLNSIKCNLILNDDNIHSHQIDSLMRLLRAYMKVEELTSLKQECELLIDYADIMMMRNDMKLELLIDLPKDLEDFQVPRLILQPIVENAIIHGLNDVHHEPKIVIEVRNNNQQIIIEVRDNGVGMPNEKINNLLAKLNNKPLHGAGKKHVGLKNVYQRLKLTYGPDIFFDIHANEIFGLSICLYIPLKSEIVSTL